MQDLSLKHGSGPKQLISTILKTVEKARTNDNDYTN